MSYELTGKIKSIAAQRKLAAGMKFGRLTAIQKMPSSPSGKSRWLYRCECGSTKEIDEYCVKSGESKSCGCLRKDYPSATTHGLSKVPEYKIWTGIINRCCNPKNDSFPGYGERGITISNEWRSSFESFYRDMGKRPSRLHSIDRINNNDGYSKENCRWATPTDQANNTRRNVLLELNQIKMNVSQWSKATGIPYSVIYRRKKKFNWSDEKTLTTPHELCQKATN